MNSRDRREPFDPLDILVRDSLRARTSHKHPAPEVRQELLRRAAVEGRRSSVRLPFSLLGLFGAAARFSYNPPPGQVISIEALFGPRLGWFSTNHIMR